MAAPKRPTHVVIHPSLYLRVNGQIQQMEKGAHLTLDGKTAERLVAKGFVASIKDAPQVDLTDE